METRRKMRLNAATEEKALNLLIKQEVEWLAEQSRAPDLANQEEELDMESIGSTNSEETPSFNIAESHAAQEFTPVPQTDDFIKTELILDEEFKDEMNDSETNCKQHVLAVTDDQQAKVAKSDKEVCGSSCREKANFNFHMDTNHLNECEICSRTFSNKYNLKRHLSTHVENLQRAFPCDLCKRTFSNKFSLRNHKRVHTKKRPTCEVCGSSFRINANLRLHMVRKHMGIAQSNTPVPQTADDDSVNTQTEEIVEEESSCNGQPSQASAAKESESRSDVKSEACEVCDCIYPTQYMRIHMSLAHYSNESKYKCELCSHTFKRKDHLKTHISTHATDRKREFACETCEKAFYHKRDLNVHNRTCVEHMLTKHLEKAPSISPAPQIVDHNSDRGTRFECKICLRTCKTKMNLKRHLTTHAKDRKMEFPCDLCKITFSNQYSLRAHKKLHNKNGFKLPAFNCEVCGASFSRKRPLELHRLRKHLDESQPITQAPQTADDHPTKTNQILKTTHTEGAGFKCEICSRSLKTKKILKLHLRTHFKDREPDFPCNLCEKKFYSSNSLWYHKKFHKLRSQHFDETQQFTPQPSNDAVLLIKNELISDEEFIAEGNDEIQSLLPKKVNNHLLPQTMSSSPESHSCG